MLEIKSKRLMKSQRKKQNRESSSGAEIEFLTRELIQETSQALLYRFKNEISKYQEGDPIELDDAKRIIDLLIREAITYRKMLIARIEKDVETGGIFERYYSKMQVINELTNSGYAIMQRMDVAEERYKYELEVYKKITGKMYEPHAIPDDASLKKKGTRKRDILETMNARKQVLEEERKAGEPGK